MSNIMIILKSGLAEVDPSLVWVDLRPCSSWPLTQTTSVSPEHSGRTRETRT